jgi:hypothetical protein
MATQWYFDTIEEAKAAMPDWDRILTTGPYWDLDEECVDKFQPVNKRRWNIEGKCPHINNSTWVIVEERRNSDTVEQIVDQIRNAETRAEAIQVARDYYDDTEYFGENIIR